MSSARQLSMESSALAYEIQQRGAAMMDHGLSMYQIDTLIDAYTNFTSRFDDPEPETMDAMLPDASPELLAKQLDDLDRSQDNQQTWHKYRTNIPWVAKPGGYTNRIFQAAAIEKTRGIVLEEDPKEFYHFSPGMKQVVKDQHSEYNWGKIPNEFSVLDTSFLAIHTAGRLLTEKTLSIIEDIHPEVRRLVTPESISTSPVRLLFYHKDQAEELGAGHYDKSVLTFQIAESHEGLRIAKDKESPLEMVRRPSETAAMFPSWGLQKEFPETPFTPGWHDITKSDVLNEGRNMPEKTAALCARWALIFFVNEANFVQPDKAITHHR
jgi:hypothetical protein